MTQSQMSAPISKVAQRRAELGNAEIDLKVDGLDEGQIKSILLADGWHNTESVELVAFAIGRAHSPLTPNKTWTYYRYINGQGMLCYSPAQAVLAISPEPFSGVSGQTSKSGQSQPAGSFTRQS